MWKADLVGLSHARTFSQNRKNITVNSVPKQCLLYLLCVRLHGQSSVFLHSLRGDSLGWEMESTLPSYSSWGCAKWSWGKQDQWRILLDLDSFWQAFINASFKTEAPLPLYTFYKEADEWPTVTAIRREIAWFGVNLPETCYPNWDLLFQSACLASVITAKRILHAANTLFWHSNVDLISVHSKTLCNQFEIVLEMLIWPLRAVVHVTGCLNYFCTSWPYIK